LHQVPFDLFARIDDLEGVPSILILQHHK
jgi:hypothetical protein